MDEITILEKISARLKQTKDIEYIKSMLYSAYSTLLLSTNFFSRNDDLKKFLTPLLSHLDEIYPDHKRPLIFKDYVYSSRSQVTARFIRVIQKANKQSIDFLIESLIKFVQENKNSSREKTSKPQKKRRNSVDDLLSRFGRK